MLFLIVSSCGSEAAPEPRGEEQTGDGGSSGADGSGATGASAATPVTAGTAAGGARAGAAGQAEPQAGAGGEIEPQAGAAGDGSTGEEDPLPLAGEPCTGYTLLGSPENDAGSEFEATLIDMEGDVVHRFGITGFPPKMLQGGSLIGCTGVFPSSYDCMQMQEVTWLGEATWSFSDWAETDDGRMGARHHHDLQREGNPVGYYAPGQDFLPEGNTLILAHARVTAPDIRDGELDDDVIYEVNWNGALTDFVWYGSDHVEQFGFDEAALEDIRNRDPGVTLEWLHGNSMSLLGPNRWFDAGHSEFHPDNIIYSSRPANIVAIISRETGDIVWRIGPDFAGRPEEGLGQFIGQHHAHLIPKGLPGAGNILVFDNGGTSGYGGTSTTGTPNRYRRDYSRVLEFDPISLEVVWQYGALSGEQHFMSRLISSAQRLPNGNTLITIGMEGRVTEVTPEHEVVWEYQYEPSSTAPKAIWIYRAIRIPADWLPEGQNAALANYPSYKALFEEP